MHPSLETELTGLLSWCRDGDANLILTLQLGAKNYNVRSQVPDIYKQTTMPFDSLSLGLTELEIELCSAV